MLIKEFNQEEFNDFVKQNDIYGFFEEPITLKSGRKSHFYANWRNVVEDVFLTEELISFIIAFVKSNNINVDTFYGVPEGATKLGILTQYEWAKLSPNYSKKSHGLSMGRAKPKEHGSPKDKFFIGVPKGKVVVIEDVTTTGGSLINTLNFLKESGVEVSSVISLTNRMEKRDDGLSVKEKIEDLGYAFFSLSNSLDLLPIMYNKLNPNKNIGLEIEKEFEKWGVEKLKSLFHPVYSDCKER
jgi:orotate phosphoribosyltransferase